ncbi:hypothetical protein CONPUDRAFT_133734 [Coniophora puteana RWD-64-598 SS2]|uniref:Uncharacterized protein n=1 Tax=Coniophora puteana (strain RWD-64-598) TaxID=741705 RepID=A0A5M3N490_CONPW|nr:uncharacterized protein CONPUDRAFT_133734 [Coniophora puteana RWD-64-598 SS2]EIW86242.1 hypothetical protein CONPUDRAFT_133734 [Coniophora puteana RWD-64-598 SS2]
MIQAQSWCRTSYKLPNGGFSITAPLHHILLPVDPNKWRSPLDEEEYVDNEPEDLDETWAYRFKMNEHVWIRARDGTWCLGYVCGQPKRGLSDLGSEGLFYPVIYTLKGPRIRNEFCPFNGDIKADTPGVRKLLAEAGWL